MHSLTKDGSCSEADQGDCTKLATQGTMRSIMKFDRKKGDLLRLFGLGEQQRKTGKFFVLKALEIGNLQVINAAKGMLAQKLTLAQVS